MLKCFVRLLTTRKVEAMTSITVDEWWSWQGRFSFFSFRLVSEVGGSSRDLVGASFCEFWDSRISAMALSFCFTL